MVYYIASVSMQIVDTSFEILDKEAPCSLFVVAQEIIFQFLHTKHNLQHMYMKSVFIPKMFTKPKQKLFPSTLRVS